MHKAVLVIVAVIAPIFCECLMQEALADGSPIIRHSKKVRQICRDLQCGPYTPCGLHCRLACPDPASCYSLYVPHKQFGPYEPYGASPKAGGFIGGRAGPLTDVALAEDQ